MSYFSTQHPSFQHNPTAPLRKEFARLAAHANWQNPKTLRRRWNECVAHELAVYEAAYVRDYSKLGGLQALCVEVGALEEEDEGQGGGGVPGSVTKCRKALRGVHVNLIDLLDARRLGKAVRRFRTAADLRNYTKQTGKFVGTGMAKSEGLQDLLKVMY